MTILIVVVALLVLAFFLYHGAAYWAWVVPAGIGLGWWAAQGGLDLPTRFGVVAGA